MGKRSAYSLFIIAATCCYSTPAATVPNFVPSQPNKLSTTELYVTSYWMNLSLFLSYKIHSFETQNVILTLAVLHLLHKRSASCEFPPRRIDPQSFTTAMNSATVRHAVLYLAARMYAAEIYTSRKQLPASGCLPYKYAAIQTIRSALSYQPSATDDDILAVILMTMSFNQVGYLTYVSKVRAHQASV